jgi:peptidoglycan hydrolase-like protein with peptidoglycan-binding domain
MQPVPFPDNPTGIRPPVAMGQTVDEQPTYQAQISCAAEALPGLVKLRERLLSTYARGWGSASPRSCTYGGTSEHKEGRAFDWMLDVNNDADRRAAGHFLAWLTADQGAMARRLGVMYVIYNKQIWRGYSPGWAAYTGASPHTDHIHISLTWNGARGHTSFWTGRTWEHDYGTCQLFMEQPGTVAGRKPRTTPCPDPAGAVHSSQRAMLWLGSTGSAVGEVQRRLGVSDTGSFGTGTRSAVLEYQRSHDLPHTGAVDDPTWARLGVGRLEAPPWSAVEAADAGHDMGDPELSRGAAGRGAYALQTALRMPAADRTGYFGPRTADAVLAAKRTAGMAADNARVSAELWAVLPQ